MLRATLFNLVALTLVSALALRVPLDPPHRGQNENQVIFDAKDAMGWNLNKLPNPNDTDHLVFETVHSLLQHWPNTRMRNGHNIVPCVIPIGTLLYRGAMDADLPPGPEWVATDPEHSYSFCRDKFQHFLPQKGCWHLTLTTTRPLKVVYFDGSSAAKIPYGPMDTQDLLAWGEARSENIWNETQRIEDLCEWGEDFGIDGFVRMEMDFEVMLCDFTSGVSVVSLTNLVSWKVVPPFWPPFVMFETMNSGSWHNHFPGETRIQLDLAGLISFYDTQLVPSLVADRAGQERWDHHVGNISNEDLSAVKSRLEAALTRPSGLSSGIDWKTLIRVIVDRFAQRFELMRYLLNSPAMNPDNILDFAYKTQAQLRIMLTPYILLSATPTDPTDKTNLDWTSSIYKLCATAHTYSLESRLMTDSEKVLLRAIRGTSQEICRVVTKMWAAGVYVGIDPSLNTQEFPDTTKVTEVWGEWTEGLSRLTAWLDWSVWVKCRPDCSPEEMCYLPTWPIGFPDSPVPSTSTTPLSDPGSRPERLAKTDLRTMVTKSFAKLMSNAIEPGPDDWVRPQPRCIRRVEPYQF